MLCSTGRRTGGSIYTNSADDAQYGRFSKVLTVSREGRKPGQFCPYPTARTPRSLPDGTNFLAYTPSSTNDRTWKRYRGGWAQDIWLFDLTTKSRAKKITDWEGTDTLPMWNEDGKTICSTSPTTAPSIGSISGR